MSEPYREIWEIPRWDLRPRYKMYRVASFPDPQNADKYLANLNQHPTDEVNYQIIIRTKPKYMSWPTWLGGQYFDNKYWVAYKRHDNAYGVEGEYKMPYLKTRADADLQMRRDLIDMGCNRGLAWFMYKWVEIFNAERWISRSWEFANG